MLARVSSLQFHVLVDLYILNGLFCVWMIKDSTRLGLSLPLKISFVLLCVFLASIGVMAYLLYRSRPLERK